jgi:hypothetical protein
MVSVLEGASISSSKFWTNPILKLQEGALSITFFVMSIDLSGLKQALRSER